MSRVLIRKASADELDRIVAEIFTLYKIDLKGKQVLIKPNILGAFSPEHGNATDPRVVSAVVREVHKQTDRIWVGDNPMRIQATSGVDEAAQVTGIYEASQGYYVNMGARARVISVGSEIIDKVPISEYFLEADCIINLPKAKTHMIAGITCCVKNMFGTVVGSNKARVHHDAGHAKRFSQFLVDLYKFFTPQLNIVDALTLMEGDGPTHGRVREGGKIIAGTNGLEVDTVVAAMMGFQEKRIKTLQLAHEAGLGEWELDKIEIMGDFEPWPNFELPSTYSAQPKFTIQKDQAAEIHEVWGEVGRLHPLLIEENCTQCGSCEEICPGQAISLEPYPVVDESSCVSCFCCAEVCPEAAMIMSPDGAQELFLRLNPQLRETP